MFRCRSPETSHPCLLPQSPKDCSINLCLFFCSAYRVIINIFLDSICMTKFTTNKKKMCQQPVFLGRGSRREFMSLPLPASGGCPHSWAPGPLPSSKPYYVHFASASVATSSSLPFPPSLTYKDPCDYIWPMSTIHNNYFILKSLV